MPGDRNTPRRLLGARIALGLAPVVAALLLGQHAAPPDAAMVPDRDVYLAMADRPFSDAPMVRHPPFCWRILPSWLVWASGLEPRTGFALLTLASAALFPLGVLSLLLAVRVSFVSALAMGGVASLAPPIVGYLSWCSAMTDAFALLLGTMAATAVVSGHRALFAASLLALALTKETWTIAAVFALLWTWRGNRRQLAIVTAVIAAALALTVTVRVAITPAEPYSLTGLLAQSFRPIDPRDIARRLLLATGATWNVLLPLASAALIRIRGTRVAAALAVPIALSTAQILIASDTARPVAAAYPFVMMAAALELDRLPPKRRVIVSILVVLAQMPWLLTYAWVVRLPLRGVELALVLATIVTAIVVWWRPRQAGGAISA